MATKKATTLLDYQLVQGSIARVVGGTKQVDTALNQNATSAKNAAVQFKDMAEAAKALGLSNTQIESLTGQTQSLAVTEAEVTTQLQAQLPLAERLAEAAKVRASAESGSLAGLRKSAFGGADGGSTGGRSVGKSIERAGRQLFNLPDVGGSTVLSRLLVLGGSAADKLGLSVGKLAGGLGVTAAVAIPALLALEAFNKGLEASKKVLTAALEAQKTYFNAVADFTTEQVKQQIDVIRDARPGLAQAIEETRAAMRAGFGVDDTTQGDLARIARGAARTISPELFTRLDELNAAYEEGIQTEARLSEGVRENVFVTNDAAEAEKDLAEARRLATEEILQATSDYTESFVRGQSLTTAQRLEEIAALKQQKASYEELAYSGTRAGDDVSVLNDKIDTLDNQIAGLEDATSEYADVLEREAAAKKALTDRNDQMLDLVDQEVKAREELFDINTRIADLETDRADKLADLTEDRADRIAEIELDSSERLADIVQDSADRRMKIERDAGRALNDAIGERDANAFRQANEKRADALADQDDAAAKQVQTVAKALEKQERTLDKSYNKQVESVNDSANKQLRLEQRKLAETEFLIASSALSQQFLVRNGMIGVENEFAGGMTRVINNINSAFAAIGTFAGGQLRGGFPTLSSTYPGGPSQSAVFNQQFDRRFSQTINASSGVRGPI